MLPIYIVNAPYLVTYIIILYITYIKRIKSDNFTRSNKEKSNIAIAILEKLMIGLFRILVVAIIFSPTV